MPATRSLLAIYDAVTDPARWRETLDEVARGVGAAGGGLYVRRLDGPPYDFMALSPVYDPMPVEEYMARHAHHEAAQWSYLSGRPPLELVLDDQAGVPRQVLDARSDYVLNRQYCGIGRRVAMRLNAIPAWHDAAIFAFDQRHGEIPAASLAALRPLLPHLAKSVEVGRAFALLRARYKAALAALDRVQVGLAIALASGEVIVHNAEAARIFACADGLGLGRDGRFLSRDPGKRDALEAAIAAAARVAEGQGGAAERPEWLELIERPSGRHPLLAEVVPLVDSGLELDRDLAGALVTIVDPDNLPPASARRFARLHRLTPAEVEVCELLVEGASGPEIAERRATSPGTVKTQIRAIIEKTGARSRGELIRLALRALPPVG